MMSVLHTRLPLLALLLCAWVGMGQEDVGFVNWEADDLDDADEGFGIIMTPASCRMRSMFKNVVVFLDEDADYYPELTVQEVTHVYNPKLKVFKSKRARDTAILSTGEINEDNIVALLEQSEKLDSEKPELLCEKTIGSMLPEEIVQTLKRFKVQRLPVPVVREKEEL